MTRPSTICQKQHCCAEQVPEMKEATLSCRIQNADRCNQCSRSSLADLPARVYQNTWWLVDPDAEANPSFIPHRRRRGGISTLGPGERRSRSRRRDRLRALTWVEWLNLKFSQTGATLCRRKCVSQAVARQVVCAHLLSALTHAAWLRQGESE